MYGYDERGRLSRKTFPNGMETTCAYDIKGQLTEPEPYPREWGYQEPISVWRPEPLRAGSNRKRGSGGL